MPNTLLTNLVWAQLRRSTRTAATKAHIRPPLRNIKTTPFNTKLNVDSVHSGLYSTPSTSVVLPHDPYYISGIDTPLKPRRRADIAPELSSLEYSLQNGEAIEAWALFERLYTDDLIYFATLPRIHWSLLLKLASQSSNDMKECWARTELIFKSMVRNSHELSHKDFARLIQTASRAGSIEVVQEVWDTIHRMNIPRSMLLWNSYMRATCNADETLWYRNFDTRRSSLVPGEPPVINDALNLVSRILNDGLMPDTTTYELVLLYLAQRGDMDYAVATISAVWGIKLEDAPIDDEHRALEIGSPVYPQISTLVAIINAYGANDQLVDGLKVMEKIQALYHIPISGDYALLLWETIMKWAYYTTEPWGSTPESTLNTIWLAVTKQNLHPNGPMFHYKSRRELSVGNYDAMFALIPRVLASRNVKNPALFARAIFQQAIHGLADAGRLNECHEALDAWAEILPAFPHVKERVLRYMVKARRHDRTPTQLALYQRSMNPVLEGLGAEEWNDTTPAFA